MSEEAMSDELLPPVHLPTGEFNLARVPKSLQAIYLEAWTMARRYEPEFSQKRREMEEGPGTVVDLLEAAFEHYYGDKQLPYVLDEDAANAQEAREDSKSR